MALERQARRVAAVNGKHYSEWAAAVKNFKREARYDLAEALLTQLVAAAEAEAAVMGRDPAPWYSDQLRIVRKKLPTRKP